jgi:hypothetical protein
MPQLTPCLLQVVAYEAGARDPGKVFTLSPAEAEGEEDIPAPLAAMVVQVSTCLPPVFAASGYLQGW